MSVRLPRMVCSLITGHTDRSVTPIIEIVLHRPICGSAGVRRNISSVGFYVAADVDRRIGGIRITIDVSRSAPKRTVIVCIAPNASGLNRGD